MITKEKVLQQLNKLIDEGEKVLESKYYNDGGDSALAALISGYYVNQDLYNDWMFKFDICIANIGLPLQIKNKINKVKNAKKTCLEKSESFLKLLKLTRESIEDDIIVFPEEDASAVVNVGSNILDSLNLHPKLNGEILNTFQHVKSNYADVILSAFRNVEDYVREKGDYIQKELYGTGLMQKAFNIDNGNLINLKDKTAEREGLRNLFAGAIGFIKNPKSHRSLHLCYDEALELLMFANYLLRTVDKNYELRRKESLFVCKDTSGAYGQAYYETKKGKVTLLKGAKIKTESKLKTPTLLNKLKSSGKLTVEGDLLVLNDNIPNIAPSKASQLILGRSSNGWVDWKNKQGKTLDEVYRK